ncbi:MAG: TlpA disulfide reductase family protein [Chloroflexota bacterium]|nr:TlpA disulfide reductase family protein [Chloroflexota bacterium]
MSELEQLEFLDQAVPTRRVGRFSLGTVVLLAGFLALALVLGLQLARQNVTQPTGGAAPDFHLKLFDGGELRLSELRGGVVLLNFWASWCPPCRDEAPDLQALHTDFSEAGLTVIGINILESSRQKALDFIDEFGLSYPNGEDRGQFIAKLYRVEAPPESFLIDKTGEIQRFVLGAVSYEDMSRSIRELLAS